MRRPYTITTAVSLLCILLWTPFATPAFALEPPGKTRALLQRLDSLAENSSVLVTFLRKRDQHLQNLISALDDPDSDLSLRAQIVLRYLGHPAGLAAIDRWTRRQSGTHAVAPAPMPSLPAVVTGNSPIDAARTFLHRSQVLNPSAPSRFRVLAYTPERNRALVQVTIDAGSWTNDCFHVLVDRDGRAWRVEAAYHVLQV